ncbi:hypothetical protein BOTBODRAFT_34506 [Botryobasidium botryosum FD-172 SS1]|uniref:Uncharacterized protein n=1 Tax=Botryobasidium botryosum (strain FD-172 SS1) TaxID=930990 RepID=A0A067MC10_BOTB1|nr:hypothetical protein BOTBODRAFT_34506 [Botryobasidium botryosum FD-172 SS1]
MDTQAKRKVMSLGDRSNASSVVTSPPSGSSMVRAKLSVSAVARGRATPRSQSPSHVRSPPSSVISVNSTQRRPPSPSRMSGRATPQNVYRPASPAVLSVPAKEPNGSSVVSRRSSVRGLTAVSTISVRADVKITSTPSSPIQESAARVRSRPPSVYVSNSAYDGNASDDGKSSNIGSSLGSSLATPSTASFPHFDVSAAASRSRTGSTVGFSLKSPTLDSLQAPVRIKSKLSSGLSKAQGPSQPTTPTTHSFHQRTRGGSISSTASSSSKHTIHHRSSSISIRRTPVAQFQPLSPPPFEKRIDNPVPYSPPHSNLSSRSSHSTASSILPYLGSELPDHTLLDRSNTQSLASDDEESHTSSREDTPLVTSSPTIKLGSVLDAATEARHNRKIADLEITNKSLLAINAMLEATKTRQAREIRDLRRRLRESRLILPPRAFKEITKRESEGGGGDNVVGSSDELSTDDEEEEDLLFERVKTMVESMVHSAQKAIEEKIEVRSGPTVLSAAEVEHYESRRHRQASGDRIVEEGDETKVDDDNPSEGSDDDVDPRLAIETVYSKDPSKVFS